VADQPSASDIAPSACDLEAFESDPVGAVDLVTCTAQIIDRYASCFDFCPEPGSFPYEQCGADLQAGFSACMSRQSDELLLALSVCH